MCFGPDGIELFFEDYGNIILVKGLNLDTGTELEPASNGAGKSTLQDIIAYTLYGKTVKKPKQLGHDKVINTISKKKLETEVQFDNYRVIRTREPNKLRVWESKDCIWEDSTEITKGTMAETQKCIDDIIGLSHNAFCNVVVFDDSNHYCFLEQDNAGKRVVIENLLGLDRCRAYQDNAKELLKEQKRIVKSFSEEYDSVVNAIKIQETHILKIEQQEQDWKTARKKDVVDLQNRILAKQAELSTTSSGEALLQYNKAQERIAELNKSIPTWCSHKEKVQSLAKEAILQLEAVQAQCNELMAIIRLHNATKTNLVLDKKKSEQFINQLNNLEEGQKCSACHGTISKDNYGKMILHEECIVSELKQKEQEEEKLILEATKKLSDKTEESKGLNSKITDCNNKLKIIDQKLLQEQTEVSSLSKVKQPNAASKEQVLQAEVSELKLQLTSKENELAGVSPYAEIMASAMEQLKNGQNHRDIKIKVLKDAEGEIPYYEYWIEAFGDKGIRKSVVDGIIPILNSRVSYWMQYLINEKIQLTFDNQLNETIYRNGVEADFHAMSNGEKRRINLAVSQAFSYIMMFNSGSCPSLVFLDEITGGGIDKSGVTGVFNMTLELAKERQIFVTTHNQNLLDLFEGCESILLIKQNDITKLSA